MLSKAILTLSLEGSVCRTHDALLSVFSPFPYYGVGVGVRKGVDTCPPLPVIYKSQLVKAFGGTS